MNLASRIRNLFSANEIDHVEVLSRHKLSKRWSMWQDLNAWIDLKAANTQKTYRRYLREFCAVHGIEFTDEGFKTLCHTTTLEASRYLTWCKAQPAQPGRSKLAADTVSLCTIKHKAIVLFALFEELINQNEVKENPFAKYKREYRKVKGNDRRPHQLIPFAKVQELFELEWKGPEDITMRVILAVLFGGGLRSCEAVNLRILDVKRTNKGNVYLNLRNTKRQKQEAQALPEWAGLLVFEHLQYRRAEGAKDSDPLFSEYTAGKCLNRPVVDRTLRRRFARALERVGLRGDYSPHCARATAITALLERGLTHRSVMKFSRHSSPDMVSHYDKMRDFEGEDVAQELNYTKKGLGSK